MLLFGCSMFVLSLLKPTVKSFKSQSISWGEMELDVHKAKFHLTPSVQIYINILHSPRIALVGAPLCKLLERSPGSPAMNR